MTSYVCGPPGDRDSHSFGARERIRSIREIVGGIRSRGIGQSVYSPAPSAMVPHRVASPLPAVRTGDGSGAAREHLGVGVSVALLTHPTFA